MAAILLLREPLGLQTRKKSDVANEINRTPIFAGASQQVEDFRREYPRATHRPVGPCWTYNCHGLTFAARRTGIHQPSEVGKILADDDYERVEFRDALPGDVAVYYSEPDGDIHHSGVVVEQTAAGPRILSKWGICHEVVHLVAECPYEARNVVFYRIRK